MHSFSKGICLNLGILPYIQLIGLNNDENDAQRVCDRLIAEEGIDPRFGEVYRKYIKSMIEYLEALETYLNVDIFKEYQKTYNALAKG